jgi:methylase of polypeptide subunit release factors
LPLNIEKILSKLIIDKGVYCPDSASISLAESALRYSGNFLEIGTGSGFVSLVLYLSGYEGIACDISQIAVECSVKNFRIYGIEHSPFVSDLFKNVSGKYDLIIFNPPTNANENNVERRIKNSLKKVLPELFWKPISKIYQNITLRSRRKFLELFIRNSKPFLNQTGIVLLNILNNDVEYFKNNSDLFEFQIVNSSPHSKIFLIRIL